MENRGGLLEIVTLVYGDHIVVSRTNSKPSLDTLDERFTAYRKTSGPLRTPLNRSARNAVSIHCARASCSCAILEKPNRSANAGVSVLA